MRLIVFILTVILTTTSISLVRAESRLSWSQQPGSLALTDGEHIVWQFNHGTEQSKPHFHPLNLRGGKTLTWQSPPDHPWHYGLWFSWKYINGVNYWEESRESRRSDGRTSWDEVKITRNDDYSAKFKLDVCYHVDDQPVVLTEQRIIDVSSPNDDGSYTIRWDATFTATADEVVLDRTPLPGEPHGEIFGGYAGLSVRLSKAASEFQATSPEVPINEQPERLRFCARSVDYAGSIDGTEGGIRITDHPDNVNSPTPWYIIHNTKTPMTFFSPTVIQQAPMRLTRGESFRLRYEIVVHYQ